MVLVVLKMIMLIKLRVTYQIMMMIKKDTVGVTNLVRML